jgi:predicted ATP-grasp superfamily ATP-dependent carboligase
MSGRKNSCVKPPLAIVGASTRSAAASAVRAGFQPLAADLFSDVDLQRIATTTRIRPYPEGFLDWMRAVEPPNWMYTGALENYPELVDQMAWISPLLGNPADVLARIRSPWELGEMLQSAGLLFPDTRESAEGLPLDGSWLAKTYKGASGSGVRVLSGERGAGSWEEIRADGVCFQKHIDGTPCAAVYIASDGSAELLGVTLQIIGEPWLHAHGFQYAGSIGPWPIAEAVRETLERLGNVLSEQFELAGLFGVDFILAGERVWTVEINPRYTASVEIVERSTGVQAIAAHIAACGGVPGAIERPGPNSGPTRFEAFDRLSRADAPARSLCHGKATLFARRDIVISQEFADFSIAESLITPWPMLGDVSSAGTPIESGRPVLTMFASGTSVADVEQGLRERVVEVERRLYTH